MEQSHMGTFKKTEEDAAATSSAYIDVEIDLSHFKHEPKLVQSVESEPAMLVKKEITEDSADDSEQQCAEVESTLASADCLYEDNCMSQDDCINVKPELEEIDVGPTVLQHMDIHYTLNKSVGDSSIEAMPCSRVEQSMEDKLRDTLFACSVHLTRLNVFQCDLCHTVYGEKRRLLQHLQAAHAGRPQTSLIVKFRRTNKQTAADNKATSYNFGQMTTEVDYDETRIKSHPGQLKPLKKRLHQQRRTRSNGFKCDRTFHKQHLLSERNKLHQRDNRNAVITSVTVAGPSNQSGDKRTKTKQKPFECEVCEKRYYSKVDLNLHKRSHSRVELKNHSVNYDSPRTRKKPYYRRDEKFARSGDLPKKNMGVQTGEKPFQCKICDTRFTQSSNLARHLKVHTGERPYQCKICDAMFAKNGVLTVHMKVHTGEKPFKCRICDARFARSNGLTLHMTVHTDEKHFQCSICDVGFKRYSSLIRHMRVHRGEKPFQCKICDARFAQSSYLNSHVRIHTGEKPFQCKICDVKFAQSGGLTHHMRIHTGEKPFQCKICDARFARSSILTSHMRVHTGEKPFKCKICNARFAHSLGLTRHIAVLHNGEKPFKCKICDARFVHSSGLTRHVKVHKSEKSLSV